MSPTLANLPTITTRRVPLPDGTTSVTLHESAKVWSGDYANMAVIQAGDDPFQAAIMDCGAQVTDRQASHMYWHGIHFKCSDYQVSDLSLLMWLVGQNQHPVGTVGGQYWHTDAKNSCLATHFVFNQCAFENDPQNTGANTGQLMQADMLWLAIVNCYADKWWSIGGGDGKLIAMGKTGGPFHFENNDWRSWTALWFTGGGGSEYTDATPSDMIIRRNWLHAPMAWTPAEVNAKRGSWTVNISASGSVTLASGTAWDNISYNPKPGCIMYDPLTGRARQIASASTTELFGNPSALQLASAWPGQPVSNLAVRFQITSTEWEVTPTLYNSGMDTPMPTATTTAGSRHVTFSEAVPQAVADRINAGDVLHLYLNNTEWYGDYYANAPSANAWTPPANHNGWGYMVGITRAQCKRKRIVSIASDRLSVETDPTQNAFAATETFPYSIVTSDGLFRHVLYHNKGSWENKTGRKWLQEGNVFEANGCRMYAVEQGYAEPPLGNVTISTDARGVCIATLLAGTAWGPYTSTWTGVTWPASTTPAAWPFGNPLRYYMGAPWQHIYLLGSTPFESEYPGFARLVHHVIDATHCELWPADPRYVPNGTRGTMGDGTYFVSWRPSTSPWMEVSHQCIRYNIWARGYPPVVYAEAPYGGHIVPGGHVTMHDNLFLRFGDRSILFDDGTNNLAALLPQDREGLFPGGSIGSGPPYVMAPGGQAVYEEPPVTGANGLYRCDHNTIARPHIAPHGATVFINTGGGITPPAKRTSFSDNLAVGLDGPVVPTGPSGITREVADTRPYLDALTTTMVGNVLVGAGTIVPATARWLHGPRNAAVTSADAVGMPNYANGATDGFALANYALAPIYTTGTISISGDGLIVTHDSGDFPTTVQTSQYIKTATHPALAKIQMASGKLGNTWNTYLGAHLFGKRNGLASPQGGGAPLAFQTNTTALPDSQWVQATNVSGSRAFGLAIRAGAPQTINGYVLVFQADAYYGEPYSNAYLVRLDNGAIGFSTLYQPGGWVELLQLAANDVWMFEAKGTLLGVSRNGTQIILYDTASNPIRYSSGLAGLASMANDPTLTVSTWSAGDYTGGGGGRVTRASDSFAGGGNQLLLETPLPERNVSAKAFAITFEGTASDGTNPGADLTTLALMTAGVRDPSRVQ